MSENKSPFDYSGREGFCDIHHRSYIGSCRDCENAAAPTQNPHTEEGEKEKCSKCGEAADTHSTICKREPILPEDNTDVAIPEEINRWIEANHDGRWGFRPGAIAMYRKMMEQIDIWQNAFNSIRIERNDFRYQLETSQMKEAAANAQIEAIQKEVARMIAIAEDFGRIIKERDLELFALNSRIEGLNDAFAVQDEELEALKEESKQLQSVIDHLHKH